MDKNIQKYGKYISDYARNNYRECLREPDGLLSHKFIVPGSCYANQLWDWDSWLTDLALCKIEGADDLSEYQKGCILNFLDHVDPDGRIPIYISPKKTALTSFGEGEKNIHKPCLAQHALYVVMQNGDAEWLRDKFEGIERYIGWYNTHCLHESGLYFWIDDLAIGVDNDPCTFYRPPKSSASIYLNCLMYKELLAVAELAKMLGMKDSYDHYKIRSQELKNSIQEHCWDERDGIFYNVDIGLLPIDPNQKLHSGCPRHWSTLIQRIEVWACFLPMWAGIATEAQAERMVREHYKCEATFNAPYGVRSLSKMEKMYAIIKSGNPSCWLGPIWGISNYMVFDGLRRYGYYEEARELAEKTITLFGRDIEQCGMMHEYYHPETGEGVNNPGFQSWNFLSLNMLEWLESIDGDADKVDYAAENTVSAEDQLDVNEYVSIFKRGGSKRVLFFGNSITRHAPKAEIGWYHDHGMAASCKNNDFVHRVVSALDEKYGKVDYCIAQGSKWEINYFDGEELLKKYYSDAREFEADIVIIRIGENMKRADIDRVDCKPYWDMMVKYFVKNPDAKVVLTDNFWYSELIYNCTKSIAEENGYTFCPIGDLSRDKSNMAIGLYDHHGVAIHPGDKGMKEIAKHILECL
jgi:putative isomerase